MSIRDTQKQAIQTILQTISYPSVPIVVSLQYKNNSDSYPYFYLVAGGVKFDWMSNQTYKEFREYYLYCGFSLNQAIATTTIDDVESLIISKLRTANTRDGQSPSVWQDINITNVTPPFQDDVNVKDNLVFKTFTIECETEPTYT